MRSIAIIGSPHRKMSNTHELIRVVHEQLEQVGWETTILFLSDLKINYCAGCGLCLTRGTCPQHDDVQSIQQKIMSSDVVILGSPVYFHHVTAQMKTFIDRCVSWGHRPCLFGKYGAAVSVYAGIGSAQSVADYLNMVLRGWGVTTVGTATAHAVFPGDLNEDAYDEARTLADSIIVRSAESVPPFDPPSDMRHLIESNKERLVADYEYWQQMGWLKQ